MEWRLFWEQEIVGSIPASAILIVVCPPKTVMPMMNEKVSATCEVWTNADRAAVEDPFIPILCGAPTAFWYPTMGGGKMPLCAEHAKPHLPHGAAISLTEYAPA